MRSLVLEGTRPEPLHVRVAERPPGAPRAAYALVIVHGTAGHGGCYDRFVAAAVARGAEVSALDLEGHGRSGGARGVFTMRSFIDSVGAVARLARERTGLPVVLLGASQGGEVAFQALQEVEHADGAVCMNVLLPAEVTLGPGVAFMRSPLAAALDAVAGDRLRVPLEAVIDFGAAYAEDPDLLAAKRRDPLYVWSYGFRSYRSVFAYAPRRRASENAKPVLVACGERDPVVPAAHCRACFERIGGPKDFFCMPDAGHQLMHFRTRRFADVVDAWVRHRVLARRADAFEPPPDRARERHAAFLEEQARAAAAPEPEYALSALDRLLLSLDNGSVAGGVRFFADRRETDFGRFVSDVVAEIDLAAWPVFERHLPAPRGATRPRMAVVGCGDGRGLQRLRAAAPALAGWDFVGVDVDPDAIEAASGRFAHDASVRFVAADVRDEGALEPASFDVVYAHGVFDHCAGHRAIVESCFRALRPGGRLFYVTPDRNLATWVGFVSAGPRFFFPLGRHRDVHDYRRFARPDEMDALLRACGFDLAEDPDDPGRPLHCGIEYRSGPLGVFAGVRRRALGALRFRLAGPRWWLGGGYRGEYLGVAIKPAGREALACART